MNNEEFFCPTELALSVLSGKWKSAILWILSFGPRRFSELQFLLGDVPRQSLTDRLRELEADGVVNRNQYQVRPQRFQYGLTQRGDELWQVTKQLCAWGKEQSPDQTFKSEQCIKLLQASRDLHKSSDKI